MTALTNAEKQKRHRLAVKERLQRYERALEFYADQWSYECGPGDVVITDYPVIKDGGGEARRALNPTTTAKI